MAAATEHASRFDPGQRIIVLHGPERFLIEQYTRAIVEMLQQQHGGVEQFHYDGATVEPAAVLDELRSYGLMQQHKVVVLDHAEQFLSGRKSGESDEGSDDEGGSSRRPLMERYAERPAPDATLIMRSETWRKGKLDALIAKCGVIVACEEQPTDKAARWCVSRCARRYEATLDPDAAALMVQRLGPSLQRLDTELLKLASMAGRGQIITRELVNDQIAPSREEKAWAIQEAIASGSPEHALRRLHELMSVSRQEWVPISWAIIDLLRKEHAAAHLIRRNMNPQGIARQLKLWGDSVNAVLGAARRHPPRHFAQLLREAVRNDMACKTGMGEPRRNLEGLMVRIADVSDTQGGVHPRTARN